jgi:quinol monooxygenase YgiN
MIQATMKMSFAPQTIDEALQILRSMIERIRAEAGCISCSVYQDTENENLVVFEEKWRSDEDLQRHLRSEGYRRVLLVMEMAFKLPEIRFDTITDSGGVEIIKEARTKRKKIMYSKKEPE